MNCMCKEDADKGCFILNTKDDDIKQKKIWWRKIDYNISNYMKKIIQKIYNEL